MKRQTWLKLTWKGEVLNEYFASVLTGKSLSHVALAPEEKDRDWENEAPSTAGEDQV